VIIGTHQRHTDDREARFVQAEAPPIHRPIFNSLQAGRGVAAVLIVLFHLSGPHLTTDRTWSYLPFASIFRWGHAGVDLFFVMSGFLIFYIHGHEAGDRAAIPRYLWKRLRRIYPIYWMVTLVALSAYFAAPGLGDGHERDPLVILSSFLLVHINSAESVLGVAWTLYHEVLFYALFAVYLYDRMIGALLGSLFVALAAVVALFGPLPGISPFYAAPNHLLFAMGIAAAWIIQEHRCHWPKRLICAGSILLPAVIWNNLAGHYLSQPFQILAYGTAASFILVGLVQLERSGRLRVPAFLVLVGNASYSIYLTHLMSLSVASKLFGGLHAKSLLAAQSEYIGLVAFAIIVGLIAYWLVERPVLKWLSREKPSAFPPTHGAELQNKT